MSISYNTSIVRNGLVLLLDAANVKSYNPNLIEYSENFTNPYWTIAAGLTIDSTTEPAPNGTNTATILTDPGSSYSYIERNITIPADTQSYVLSFFLKKANSTIDVAMNARLLGGTEVSTFPRVAPDGTGTGNYTLVDVGSWWRVYFTLTNNGTNTSLQYRFYPAARSTGTDDPTVTGSNTVWGFMVNRGSTVLPYVSNSGKSSDTWYDLSGNNNNGSNSNITFSADNSGYFSFNDTSSVSTIPNSPSLNPTTGLTIDSWVWFNANSQDFIFEKGNVNTQYSLFSHGDDVVFRTFHVGDASYDSLDISKTALGVSNNTWHHIVGTWDGSTKKLYIDGIEKGSGAKSGEIVTTTPGASVGRFGGTTAGYYFGGRISNVKIYNKGLSAQEIKQNFEAHSGRYGL